jgi:hypothetical protein
MDEPPSALSTVDSPAGSGLAVDRDSDSTTGSDSDDSGSSLEDHSPCLRVTEALHV